MNSPSTTHEAPVSMKLLVFSGTLSKSHLSELAIKFLLRSIISIKCSSVGNLTLRLVWSRSNILPVLSDMLVLTIVLGVATAVSIDIATTCTAIAASIATVATTIVAVVFIGIRLALVGTFSCPVSRFATSVAISRLGASWLSAYLGLKQGIDLSASVSLCWEVYCTCRHVPLNFLLL